MIFHCKTLRKKNSQHVENAPTSVWPLLLLFDGCDITVLLSSGEALNNEFTADVTKLSSEVPPLGLFLAFDVGTNGLGGVVVVVAAAAGFAAIGSVVSNFVVDSSRLYGMLFCCRPSVRYSGVGRRNAETV